MNGFSVLALLLVAAAVVSAEPPRFRRVQRFRAGRPQQFARQEVETTTSAEENSSDPSAPYPAAGAPYPPSGWKPSGRLLRLPTERQQQPPATSYGTPDSAYGPPQEETTTPADDDSEDATPNPEAENLSEVEQVGFRGQQQQPNNGYYFVQLAVPPQTVVPASLRVQPVALTEQVYFSQPIVVPPSRVVSYNSAFTQTW
ncbi:hypothetical protein DMENIID0001_077520 [Sergentomyia squamirostris]